jgi:hypothetical protein
MIPKNRLISGMVKNRECPCLIKKTSSIFLPFQGIAAPGGEGKIALPQAGNCTEAPGAAAAKGRKGRRPKSVKFKVSTVKFYL